MSNRERMIINFLLDRRVHRIVAERAVESLQPLCRIADSGRIQLIAADRLDRASTAEVLNFALGRPVTDAVPYYPAGKDIEELDRRHQKMSACIGRLFVASFPIPNDAELDHVMNAALLDDIGKAVLDTLFPYLPVRYFLGLKVAANLVLDHVVLSYVSAVARNEVQQMTRITNLLPVLPRVIPLCGLVQDPTRILVLTGPKQT